MAKPSRSSSRSSSSRSSSSGSSPPCARKRARRSRRPTALVEAEVMRTGRLEVGELVLVDAQRRPRLRALVENDSIELALLDMEGVTRLALYVDPQIDYAAVNLFDETGACLAQLSNSPSLSLSHREDGKPVEEERVCIAVCPNGHPVLEIGKFGK